MSAPASLIPRRVNSGSFITAYTHAELLTRTRDARIVLPICSLGTPAEPLAALGPWVLPPLYHEALTPELKEQLVARIRQCIPYYEGTQARANWSGRVEVVELPRTALPSRPKPRVFAFSVDTGVEQHGPHLPLATDTIQSYAVLEKLATEFEGFVVGPPVDYGQLTWGLPFGFSIDVTAPLLTRYLTGFANAIVDWLAPAALYVVDVHGSLVHRNAIQAGLKASRSPHHAFRWLHDSLLAFSADRADMHAGGVETIIVETISRDLLDARWWPGRKQDLAAHEMPVPTAVELSGALGKFIRHVESGSLNGIIGRLENYDSLSGPALFDQMCAVARADVRQMLARAAS